MAGNRRRKRENSGMHAFLYVLVVLVLLCVAFRVGLGNHIARQIVGKGLRCAVGVGHLLQQAFGGVGTPKIIL